MTFKEEIYNEWRERTGFISNEDGEKWLNSIIDRTIQLCKDAVPDEVKKHSDIENCGYFAQDYWQTGTYHDISAQEAEVFNACRNTTLQNLSALEKE